MSLFTFINEQKMDISFRWMILLPVLSIGMAPSVALSVLKGMFHRGGVFERTPKFGVSWRERLPGLAFLYRRQSISYIIMYLIMYLLLFVYSVLPVVFAWQRETWLAVPFLLIFPLGYLLVFSKDLSELKK